MHLSSLFLKSCQQHAQRMLHPHLTYNDLYRKSSSYLYYLKNHLKIQPQQRIVLRSPKSYHWAPFFLACFRNNNIVIPLPFSSNHLPFLLSMTKPQIVIDNLQPFEDCVQSITDSEKIFDVHSPALILFTSGSSALPKGVVLSHSNIFHNLYQLNSVFRSFVDIHDRSYSLLPWYHCYGLICELFYTIIKGSHIFLSGYQHPFENFKHMSSFHPTVIQLVPKMIYAMEKVCQDSLLFRWQTPASRRRLLFGSEIRMITVGGANCLPSSLEYIHTSLDVPIYQGYGMTEMSPMVSFSTDPSDYHSVGSLLPFIQSKIDPRSNELLLQGPNQMMGYLKDIICDHKIVVERPWSLENPWYATGDKAFFQSNDQKCTLSISGRTQDIYKMSNGKFVNPLFLESLLEKHPQIQQCFIFTSTGIYNEALIYSDSFSKRTYTYMLSLVHSILQDQNISSTLWPRQIRFLKSPFSIENGFLSIKHEKRRSRILSKLKEDKLDLYP